MARIVFPIRLKLLLTLLLVVSAVVGVITATVAHLFQEDKTTYIFDATTAVALHLAQESDTLLSGYSQQMKALSDAALAEGLDPQAQEALLNHLFANFEDILSITQYDAAGVAQTTRYHAAYLREAGILPDDFLQHQAGYPIPVMQLQDGDVYLRNSTFSPDLPVFTLARAFVADDRAAPVVIAARIHLRKLLALAGQSGVFTTFLVDDQGTLLSHPDSDAVSARKNVSRLPVVDAFLGGPGGSRAALAGTLAYSDQGQAFLGAYARGDAGRFGAIVQTPKGTAYLTAQALIKTLIAVASGALVFSAFASLFLARRLTDPLQALSQATRAVASGDFNVQIAVKSRDEVGLLAHSFNTMATELKARETALQATQAALVQSEKMAAFGQLGAGIAHEVKNPLAGILGYAQLALRKTPPESPLARPLGIIEKETKRCKAIIDNLLRFARAEKTAFEPLNLNQVVEDAVAIVDHQLSLNRIQLQKACAPQPLQISGNANQIQQVLINLMINAQQAMPDGGAMQIGTRRVANQIEVFVSDTGPGIPPEIQAKIFEPFFTTKPVGQGTGLGLSVSYGIVKDHGGQIRLESEPGKGTTFRLTFPE